MGDNDNDSDDEVVVLEAPPPAPEKAAGVEASAALFDHFKTLDVDHISGKGKKSGFKLCECIHCRRDWDIDQNERRSGKKQRR
jgi:hypothetical protein